MSSWGYDVTKNKVGVFWLANARIPRDHADRSSALVSYAPKISVGLSVLYYLRYCFA